MKKIFAAVLSLALLGAAAVPAVAADPEPPRLLACASAEAEPAETENAPGFAVEVDGERTGAQGCVLVPLHSVAEKLGFTVTGNNDAVTVTGPERYAELTVGVNQYFAAPTREGMMGASLFSLSCAPVRINDMLYVPVELFDALLGCREGTVVLEGNTIRLHTNPAAVPVGGDPATWGPAMDAVQMPNPFMDHAALADAIRATGFPLSCPDTLEGYPLRSIQTMRDEMIQVIYQNGDSSVHVRKEAGSGDISGDYNRYSQSETAAINGSTVTMRGENGLMRVALWENGGYTYAVTSDAGMSIAAMTALVQSVR